MVVALQAVLRERLKDFARRRERHLAAIAVEQPRAHLILQRPYLRRDRRLRHHQLLRRARKAPQTADFHNRSQLLKVHARSTPVPDGMPPFYPLQSQLWVPHPFAFSAKGWEA